MPAARQPASPTAARSAFGSRRAAPSAAPRPAPASPAGGYSSAAATPAGPRRPLSAYVPQMDLRMWVGVIGLAVALLGTFLPWASVPGADVSPFNENGRFRLGDWFDMDLIDGALTALLALGAASLTVAASFTEIDGWKLIRVVRVLIVALLLAAILEVQFVLSLDGADASLGLIALIVGAVVAAGAAFIPSGLLKSLRPAQA